MRAYILVILAIVAGVKSGPINIDDNTCATTCTESAKFAYEAGNTYSFAYEADTVTSLLGASEEHSSLHVQATAEVHVLSQCELALTLRDVTLEHSDPSDFNRRSLSENSKQFKQALEARPIKFSFQDGHVDAVCADSEDPTWVANVKRGIISGLQNTMKNLDESHVVSETDVTGVCDAEYKVSKRGWGGATSVTKTKDLSACTDRHGHFSSLQATPYKLSSDIQSLPLLRGTHQCDQTINKDGVMERSEIRETHTFRPFSSQESGATTTTRQLMSFLNKKPTQTRLNTGNLLRSSLLFDHSDQSGTEQGAEEVIEVLKEICELSDVRPETPRLYSRLVYAMRKVDAATMRSLHTQVERESVCQKNSVMAKEFFHDAIPSVSTAASANLMRELIESGEMSHIDADMWLTSLAFVAQPSSEMIREVTPLLQGQQTTRKMYLSISTLVHSYCRQNDDCEFNQDVQQVLNAITANLGYNCRESDNEKILMSLKSLGNIGIASQAVPVLGRCLANAELPMEIRVAAIEAFHRMPCGNHAEVMNMFLNAEEDSELRIKSYLAVMQCPSEEVLAQVREMLAGEQVNQVGSFVWTHINNLKETSDIFKQGIQDILEDETLQKEFNLDARKFSRNYEASMFFDSLNAGAKVESNLIWSPKSFVPRSAMLNLTVDLFGHSVNFLEVGGRVEGAEDFLQKMFGPDGYFPAEKREKRSANSDNLLTDLNRADPKAAMYMKMFGNELRYWDLTEVTDVEKEDFNVLDLLIKLAQENEVEWSRSAMFLDSELSIPTAIGMPLKLSINGSATVDVKVGGKMDIRQLAVYPNSMDINGYVKPSGAIEFSSVMGLDAFVAQTGLKMVSTLHTSTEIDGLIKLDESRAITAKFNMPKDKIEIINVKTQFFIVNKGEEREQAMLTDNRVDMSKCSSMHLEKALGVRLCADVSYPASNKADAPYFPFTGPVSAAIALHKVDDHESYEFEAYLKTVKEKGSLNRFARLAFNTPGSKVDREIVAEISLDSSDQKLSASLKTPWKQATVDGSLVNARELKSARFDVTVDKKPAFSVISEIQIDSRPKATKVSPNVEIRWGNKPVMTVVGDAKYVNGDKFDTDLTLDSSMLKSPIVLKGSIDSASAKGKNRYDTDMVLRSPFINTKVAGFTQTKDGLLSTRMEFRYDWNDASKHLFIVNGKAKDMSKDKLSRYMVNGAITSTEFPDYNIEVDADLMKNPKHMETSLDIHYGQDNKDLTKRILINQELDVTGNLKNMNIDHVAKLKWRAMGLDLQSKMSHSHSLYNNLKTNAKFSYSPNKDVTLNVDLQREQSDLTKMSGNVVLEIPGREMRLSKSIEQKSADEFNHEMLIQWQKGGQVRTTSVYTRIPSERRHEITTELYGPVGKPTIITGSATLKIDDFAAKAQVAHKGDIYRAETRYDYNLAAPQISMNANIDVNYPSRHITAETALSSSSNEHSVSIKSMWNADRDASQKFNLNGVLNMQSGSHEGDLKVIIPSRTVSMSFNNKYDGEKFDSRADLSWAPQQTISLTSSGSFEISAFSQKVQGSMQVSTPFADQIQLNVNHRFNKRRLENQMDVSYGAEKMGSTDLSVQLLNGVQAMENKLSITTPIPAFKQLSVEQSHSLTNKAFTGHVEGSINKKAIAVDMNGELQGSSVKSSASVQTPFNAIRKASVSWEHDDQTAHLEGSFNRQKVVVDVSNVMSSSILNNKVSIMSTFEALRKAEATTMVSLKKAAGEGSFALTHNDNQVISLTGELKFGADIEGKVAVQSRFNNMEDLSSMFFVKKSQTPQIAHAEFKWAENKVIALDGELTQAGYENVNTELRFTSPFPTLERLVLNHQHSNKRGQWQTVSAFEYGPRKTVQLATTFSNDRGVATTFKLETPCPYFKTLTANLNHAGGYSTNFNNKIAMQFENNYASFEIDHTLTMRGATYLVGTSKVSSSLFGDVSVSTDHQDVNGELISKVDISMPSRQKVSVETHFDNREEMKASAQITTTFPEVPSFIARVNHQGRGAYFVNKVSVESQIMRQQVNFKSDIQINGAESQDISLQLTSPFENMENLAFALRHSFDGETLECHSEVQIDSRRSIVVDNKVSMARGFSLNTEIKTPFRTFRSLIVDVQHDGAMTRFNNKASVKAVTVDGLTSYDSSLSVTGIRSINGQMTFTSPFNQMRSAEMSVKHGLKGNAWMTNFGMTLPSSDKFEFNSNINMEELSANILLKSPFADDISFTASHTGPWNNFESKMELTQNANRIASDASFKFDARNLMANLAIDVPFIDHIEVSVSHAEKSAGKYDCSASAKAGSKEIVATANIDVQSVEQFSTEFALSTPFRALRQIALNMQHSGSLNNFNNKIEFVCNNEKSVYVGSFENGRAISGDFKITSPYKPVEFMQAQFSSNGMRRNSIEVSYAEGKKVEATSVINMKNGFQATIEMNAPFCSPISVNINCADMSHSTEVAYGNQRVALSAEMSMSPLSAKVTFASPFEAVSNLEWTISGTGSDIGSFTVQTAFSHNSKKTFDFNVEFYSRDSVNGKADWTSSFKGFEAISLQFNHEGSMEDFETTGMLSYAPTKKIATKLQVKTSPKVEVHFNIDTPCTYFANLNVNFDHSGSLSNFQTIGDLSFNGDKMGDMEVTFSTDRFSVAGNAKMNSVFLNLDTSFSHKSNRKLVQTEAKVVYNGNTISGEARVVMSPSIEVSLTFQSPCEYFRDVTLQLTHADDTNTISNSLVIKTDRFGKMRTDTTLKRNPIEANIRVQTPCQYLRDASLVMKHSGAISDFTNELQLSHSQYGDASYSGKFSANPIMGDFEIKTPVSQVKVLKVTFDHMPKARGFQSNSMVAINSKEYKMAADVSTYPESSITIETPHPVLRKLFAIVKSNNNVENFEGSVNVMRNDDAFISSEIAWQTLGKIEGSYKLNTVFDVLRSVEASVRHEGNVQRFNNFVDLRYNDGLLFHGETDFNMTPLKGSFSIETPVTTLRSLKAAFSHQGNYQQFRTHGEFTYNTNNQYMADVAFKRYPGIEATFQITTPFHQLESVSLKVNHQGAIQAFQSNAEMTINKRDKYGAQIQFTIEPEVDGKISIASPIKGYRNINAGIHFAGNRDAFNGRADLSADNKSFVVDGSFQVRPLQGKISVQTPFTNYEDLSAEISHKGNFKAFTSRAAVAYQTGKAIEADVDFSNYARVNAGLAVKTPFSGFEELELRLKNKEENYAVDFKYGSEKASADLNLKLSPNFEGKLDIATPIKGYRKILASATHQMTSTGIDSNALFAIGGSSMDVSVNGEFNSVNDMKASAVVNTPFKGYRTMKIAGSHQSNPAIKTNFEASVEDKKVQAELDMARSNDIEASVTINTPFYGYEELTASLNHAGNLRKFTTIMAVKYAQGKDMEVTASFDSTSDIDGVFKFNCPCPYIQSVGAEFHLQGDYYNFEGNGKLYQDNKQITLATKYASQNGIPTLMTAKFTSPFANDVTFDASNDYRRNGKYQTSGSLAWAPSKKIDVQSAGVLQGSLTELLLNGNLQINTPFRAFNQMQINTEHQHSSDGVSTKLDVNFNKQKVLDTEVAYSQASGKLEMQVPYKMAASVDTAGDASALTSDVELKWSSDNMVKFQVIHKDQSSSSGVERELTIRTITGYRTMSFTTGLTKNAYTMTHNAALSWDEARDKTVSYKVNFNDQSRRNKHLYTVEARLDTPIRSAEFVMNHNDDSATFNTEANFKWDAARDQNKMMSVSNKYTKSGNTHDDELTISHPALQKALVLRNTFALNDDKVLFNGRSEIDFLTTPVAINVLLEDKATEYGATNYTMTVGCSHPSSTLDIQVVAHAANSQSSMTSGIVVDYLTARRQQVNLQLQAQINKIKKSMNIQIDTPMKKVEISGDLSRVSRGYAVNVAAESEGQSLNGRLETGNKDFDMKLFYSPENEANVMHVSGKYLSPTDMMLEAYRMHNGQRVTESTVNIDLENGHLLKSSIYWRPSMVSELQSKIQSAGRAISRQVTEMVAESSKAINMEIRYKQQLIVSNLPDMSPLMSSMSDEIDSLKRDAMIVSRAFNQMYYRDEFYMKTIDEVFESVQVAMERAMIEVAEAFNYAGIVFAQKWEQFIFQARLGAFKAVAYVNRYAEVMMESMYQGMGFAKSQLYSTLVVVGDMTADLRKNITAKFVVYKDEIVSYSLNLAERVLVAVKPVMEMCIDLYDRASHCISRVSESASTQFQAVKRKLPLVYLTKKWNQAMNTVSAIDILTPVSDVQVSIRDKVKNVVTSFNGAVTKMARKSTRSLYDGSEILNARFSDFLEHDDTKYAHELVQEAYKQAKAAFEYLEVEQRTKDLIKQTADTIVRVVRKNAFYVVDDYLNLDQDKIINYNPREGKLDFQIWVPMQLPSIQAVSIPDFELIKEIYAKVTEIVMNLIPDDFSPYDFYYQYMPNTETIYPPFEAYAMISGAQHYMTFDKKFFEFAGSCSYTLAREFVDQTFEVLVNYDDDREVLRKSLTVRTEGKEVEIFTTGVVSIDGVQTELPVSIGQAQITRQGHMIQLLSNKGFAVSCDIANDMCMLNISGWYYNKVAGLFGTYTNEQVDDMLTSDARLAANVDDFTHSWVSGKCRNVENRARAWDSQTKVACQKLFNNKESQFRRCYKVVDPTPFLQMCANDVIDDVTDMGDERSACKAAAMYVMSCKKEGVPLRLPRACVACDKPSYDQYNEGEELTAFAADQSADVIFVIEEKPCNKEALNKLGDLASQIDAALKSKALSNNQFGLIGFGGEGIHDGEHIQTISGKILGSSKEFGTAVQSLKFNIEGSNTDVFKALRMAAKYPFRAGVAKSIVLITCSECTEQAARYNEIKYNLQTRGINLHVIMEHEFTLGASDIETPKTSYLFGIDKDTAFTTRHVSDQKLEGDADLFAMIEQPTTMCARLAQETDGSFFNINKMTAGRVRFQKHFTDVFSRRVAKSANVPNCQVCECESDANGAARSVCKPCNGAASSLDKQVVGLPPVPAQFYQAAPQMDLDYEEA
jgi:hypothetical protein